MEIKRRIVEQIPTCKCKHICNGGDISSGLVVGGNINEVGDYCESCSQLLWIIVRTLPSHVESVRAAEYFAVVSCPGCKSFQGVPLMRDNANFGNKEEQTCSVCGTCFHTFGELLVVEVQRFSDILNN